MARLSLAVATAAALLVTAAAAPNTTVTARAARAAAAAAPVAAAATQGSPRRTRSCDPALVLCVDSDAGYSPSFQEPRFYEVGVRRLPPPPLPPSYRLAPPLFPVVPPPAVPVIPPPPSFRFIQPAVPIIPPPVRFIPPPVRFIPPPVRFIPPPVRFIPQPEVRFIPQPEVRVIPQPEVRVIPQPEVRVIPQPEVRVVSVPDVRVVPAVTSVIRQSYPVVPRPYPSDSNTRLFPTYPATSSKVPGHTDIRSFYQSAVLVGEGVVHQGDRSAELICDFTTNGPYPSSDILTDVVWQRLGADGVYMNTPMTSGANNALFCPSNYVVPPPVNYGFNVVGTRTSLVIQNAGGRDHGTYRCYATRVNRLNPDDRHPVYMVIQFTGDTPRTGLVG